MPAQIHPNALKPGSGRGGGSSFKRAASQASMSLGSFRKPIAQQRNERGLRRTVDVAPTDSKHAGKAAWRLYERVAVAGCIWEGMVLIPYLVGMGERYSPPTLAVALAFDAFYAADLALKARKLWSDRALDAAGEDESRCVRALYVASRLWVEIVACLPLGLTVGAAVDGAINGPTFAAFRLNKVLRARRLLLHMRRAKNNIRYNWDVMDVGFILVLQLWLQHIFALVWHAASSTQPGGWVRRYDGAWFLKANPISTAAKLCNSSLNSSKTNSRVSSAVATLVVRSRRGSHDAGRSRGGRLTGRRHAVGFFRSGAVSPPLVSEAETPTMSPPWWEEVVRVVPADLTC